MNTQDDLDLTVIPMQHFGWHQWCLRVAHAFVWIGFCIASYHAWSEEDWVLLGVSLLLLGIGLLIFRGVGFFMHVWVILSQWLSAREIREEMEIKEANEEE